MFEGTPIVCGNGCVITWYLELRKNQKQEPKVRVYRQPAEDLAVQVLERGHNLPIAIRRQSTSGCPGAVAAKYKAIEGSSACGVGW